MRSIVVWLHLLLVGLTVFQCMSSGTDHGLSPDECLSLGDSALSAESNARAIEHYELGIAALGGGNGRWSLLTVLSLETNLATAYSAIGRNKDAIEHYRRAIVVYSEQIENTDDEEITKAATAIASQSSFFLGMVLQDENSNAQRAVEAYGYAVALDPKMWAAWANLGSVLHDQLRNYDDALNAYNKAYLILTESENPTDAPAEPRFILSQLQYRIGLCLNHDVNRKCSIADDPATEVSCIEMATHAFSLAVKYDRNNESANHMLATVTADATMKRASNTYVKNLFDDYAQKCVNATILEGSS
jgi:tetratricopeptide (TPR) repeat protein